jgi:hypothetical protein
VAIRIIAYERAQKKYCNSTQSKTYTFRVLRLLIVSTLAMVTLVAACSSPATISTVTAPTSPAPVVSTSTAQTANTQTQATTTTATPHTSTALTSSTTTNTGGPGTGTASTTTVAGYTIKVIFKGSTTVTLNVADLDGLPQLPVVADGKSYTGPTILSMIVKAGISSFTKVTVIGYTKGRLATAELELAKAELNDKMILRKTNQNTFSLASPDVAADSWIIDVTELKVE